jgi:hypothetical protein
VIDVVFMDMSDNDRRIVCVEMPVPEVGQIVWINEESFMTRSITWFVFDRQTVKASACAHVRVTKWTITHTV